jgi:hypothetical protein
VVRQDGRIVSREHIRYLDRGDTRNARQQLMGKQLLRRTGRAKD